MVSMYFDDDEELNEYRRRFGAAGARTPSYDLGSPQLQGSMGYEYEPAVVESYLGQKPQTYTDPGQVVPMREDNRSWLEKNGFDLAMAGMDIALNGGRGLGRIADTSMRRQLSEGEQLRQEYELDRQAWTKQQGMEMERAQMDRQGRYQDAQIEHWGNLDRLAGERLDHSGDRIETAQQREARLREAHNFRFDPSNPQTQAVLEELRRRGVQLPEGLSQEALKPLGGAVREDMETSLAPQRAKEAAGQAAAVTQAQTPGLVDRERQMGPARAESAGDRQSAVNDANAPLRAEAGGRKDAAAHQGLLDKFRNETEKTRPQLVIAADLDALLSGYANADQPGVGLWDSWKSGKLSSDDDLKVRNAIDNMTDLVARVRSGAAIPPPEYEMIKNFVSGGQVSTEQQFRVAWEAYRNGLRRELQQQAAGREDAALEVLGEYGGWSGIKTPVRMGLGQPPAPRSINGGAAAAPVIMTNPQTGESGPVPPELVERARAAGWR